MEKATIYYSDPLFNELLADVPQEIKRHQTLLFGIGYRIDEILKRKGWTQADLAKAMGKKEPEISKWMGGGHNFTINTIAKIEAVLGEEILTIKRYRKPVTGYSRVTERQRRYLSERKEGYSGKGK